MKAMIFAAGLGTRLKPLTLHKPKALVEINEKTLLQIQIEKLIAINITDIVINVHHYADSIKSFVKQKNFSANIFISDESELLLDTGGGLLKAKSFFNSSDDILIHNVDIISKIDLNDMIHFHKKNNNLVSLAVSDRKTSRYLHFDDNNKLCGWENSKTGEAIKVNNNNTFKKLAFSGIHIINYQLLNLMNQSGSFPIIPVYLQLATKHTIVGYKHNATNWIDVGKPENLKKAESLI